MIKEIAWKTFKNTGNIDTFMELRQLENYEKANLKGGDKDEYCKNERNSNCRK